MTTKRWTDAEDKKILKAIKRGISLTVIKLKGRSSSSKYQRATKLRKGTAATLTPPDTDTAKPVRKSVSKTGDSRIPWTPEEDQILREGRAKGRQYSKIKIKGRSTGSKRTHWNALEKANSKQPQKSSWTSAEETLLRQYKQEKRQYADMKIRGRTATAIKYHWLSSMNLRNLEDSKDSKGSKATKGSIKSRHWTPEQERALYKDKSSGKPNHKVRVMGRSASSIRNHWGLHKDRLKKEYADGKTPAPTAVETTVETVNVSADFSRPKIHVELKKLCKGYTAFTIPDELGNYCYLLDEAVKVGWLPQEIQPDSSTLQAPEDHSDTDAKTLHITKTAGMVLQTRSKVRIWKTKLMTCKSDTPIARKVQVLEGLLTSQVFDRRGNFSPISTKG